ncbi:hypothetical protein BDIM_14940 [Brevundimonas diminuta ATCC 11568]|nr:hypothetical protein BDIM_14940 [Brevundimonas diminuta ATCC 11568]
MTRTSLRSGRSLAVEADAPTVVGEQLNTRHSHDRGLGGHGWDGRPRIAGRNMAGPGRWADRYRDGDFHRSARPVGRTTGPTGSPSGVPQLGRWRPSGNPVPIRSAAQTRQLPASGDSDGARRNLFRHDGSLLQHRLRPRVSIRSAGHDDGRYRQHLLCGRGCGRRSDLAPDGYRPARGRKNTSDHLRNRSPVQGVSRHHQHCGSGTPLIAQPPCLNDQREDSAHRPKDSECCASAHGRSSNRALPRADAGTRPLLQLWMRRATCRDGRRSPRRSRVRYGRDTPTASAACRSVSPSARMNSPNVTTRDVPDRHIASQTICVCTDLPTPQSLRDNAP